jgi:tetratricopeptide (TPR) repeat protein
MRATFRTVITAAALAALLAGAGVAAAASRDAQSSQQNPPAAQQPPQQQPAPGDKNTPPGDKNKEAAPISMDQQAAAQSSPEEEAAFKAFQDAPVSDPAKKDQLGEEFIQKYPQSKYRGAVYQGLVSGYFATNQVPKLLDAGDKELALNPNDAPVLAVVAQTIARSFNGKAPDAQQQLDKAEQYSKRAIEITPTLPKPPNLTDDAFVMAKNDTLEMAHGGLGLVYIRKAKFAEAIPELEQSIKADTHPQQDPVNYYLLGMAHSKTSHYDAAAAAFNKCASIQSSLQPTCKAGADEAKKAGSTQMSAPN